MIPPLVFEKHLTQPWGGGVSGIKWMLVGPHKNNIIAVPGENIIIIVIIIMIIIILFTTVVCGGSARPHNWELINTWSTLVHLSTS